MQDLRIKWQRRCNDLDVRTHYVSNAHQCRDRHRMCRAWKLTGQRPLILSERLGYLVWSRSLARASESHALKPKLLTRSSPILGQCSKNAKYMTDQCQLSCGLCDVKVGGASKCTDLDKRCGRWEKRGDCLTNAVWMRSHCAKACSFCVDCADKRQECAAWRRGGHPRTHPALRLTSS